MALHVKDGFNVDAEYLTDLLNAALDREFGRTGEELASVRYLGSEEELRAYQAGEMVLYRKPARRHGNVITYRRDGIEHRLEQLTTFDG